MADPVLRSAAGQLGEYVSVSREGRTMGEILRDIVAHAEEIVRAEAQLAKTEIRQEAVKAIRGAVVGAIGAVVGLFGFGFLMLACVYSLSLLVPNWAAALIVGFILSAIGGVCCALGRERWQALHKPDRTIGEMKENVEWLKHPTKS